nr:RNA-directed DNA polymerase, eukaryota [Tanacetum cinerariifolium]
MLRRLEQNPTEVELDENSIGHASKIATSVSIGHGRFKKSVAPCNGGSILSLMVEVVRVGQTMGYKMEWCVNNITEIIESQGAAEGSVAETESNILIVVVYAPHDYRDKRILWDYLSHVSNQWNGDVVMMEDFNEVRHKSDRFRSVLMPMVNGFDKLVMNSWYDAPSHGNNAILSFMSKLKFLKTRIKEWNVDYRRSSNVVADKLKEELLEIDAEIDNGNGNADIVARGMLNKKRSQSNIQGVLIDGKWTDEPVKVKGQFFHHFSNRFGKPSDDQVEIDMNFPNTLSVDQKADLESMVNIEEVKRAVWDCRSDKAPGPDGQILDGPFIVNEAIQWCKKKKKHALIFKVDFEKAYDSGGWDYLDDVLDKFGFGIQWRGWIQNCLRSSRGSILINGSPTEEFQFFKGLKQGFRIEDQHVKKQDHGHSCEQENVNDAAATLGCLTLKTPFVYLGTKVRDNMSRVDAWKDIVEKVSSWLSRWKLKTLSIKGVPSLYALNRGLLLKWVWRFHSKSASLWTRVIKAIHGVDGGL